MNIYSVRFTLACYVYVYIGICIFLLGWVKTVFAVPALVLIALALWEHRKKLQAEDGASSVILIHPVILILVGVFCVLFCVLCGQGAFLQQPSDWDKHNRVLNDLVFNQWPVCYHNDSGEAMLTYYIAQYLLPALCGKITSSFRVAEIALLLCNAAGLFCVVLLLFRAVKAATPKKQIITILVFVFFGTCLFLAKALYGATGVGAADISAARHWISNSIQLQYRSLYVNLRWAFPQAIVPWIATLLFAENYKDVSRYCLIGAPLLLHATFPLLGLAALMFGVVLFRAFTEKNLKALAKEIFCLQNMSIAVSFFIPLCYILGNVLQKKAEEVGFAYIKYEAKTVLYFCFIAAFLAYSVIIYKQHQTKLLFYLVNLSLLIFPFFRMGVYNDFSMGASIPAILLLMVFVIQALFQYGSHVKRDSKRLMVLLLLLVIGSIYPMEEMVEVIKTPVSFQGAQHGTLGDWAHRDGSIGAAEAYNYFTYDYETSLFYRFFGKR